MVVDSVEEVPSLTPEMAQPVEPLEEQPVDTVPPTQEEKDELPNATPETQMDGAPTNGTDPEDLMGTVKDFWLEKSKLVRPPKRERILWDTCMTPKTLQVGKICH